MRFLLVVARVLRRSFDRGVWRRYTEKNEPDENLKLPVYLFNNVLIEQSKHGNKGRRANVTPHNGDQCIEGTSVIDRALLKLDWQWEESI